MTKRQLIVVDLETTSLDMETCSILEVAAVNVTTGEEFAFAPYISDEALHAADPEALAVNRYYERRVFAEMVSSENTSRIRFQTLSGFLGRNTFAGSNPGFDSSILRRHPMITGGWHHRLADISPLTAGALGLDPTDLPGLAKCCELLGVLNTEPHSALGDARATADCFRAIAKLRKA